MLFLFFINLCNENRITSYNVCYTKLLRIHKENNPNLTIGEFYNVEVTDAEDYDLFGVVK